MNHQLLPPVVQPHHQASGRALLVGVSPFLTSNNEPGLIRYLRTVWSLTDLFGLLNNADSQVRRTTACCLGMIGGRAAVLPLVSLLCDEESTVVAAAEDALWRLWFSAAGHVACRKLRRAVGLIEEGRYDATIEALDDLIASEPDFAEAYHQRALAHHLQGDYLASLADYKHTVRLNSCHFGALAGMGRALADLGQIPASLASYRRALGVHPRMEGVRQSIRKIRSLQESYRSIAHDPRTSGRNRARIQAYADERAFVYRAKHDPVGYEK